MKICLFFSTLIDRLSLKIVCELFFFCVSSVERILRSSYCDSDEEFRSIEMEVINF